MFIADFVVADKYTLATTTHPVHVHKMFIMHVSPSMCMAICTNTVFRLLYVAKLYVMFAGLK